MSQTRLLNGNKSRFDIRERASERSQYLPIPARLHTSKSQFEAAPVAKHLSASTAHAPLHHRVNTLGKKTLSFAPLISGA
jgi:hypothetical protein